MKVLIACEESQRVCKAFRALGHEAYSADIQEPSGGLPGFHILGDVLQVINGGKFKTMDGVAHTEPKFIDGKGRARYFTDSTYNKKARSVTFEGMAAAMAWQFTHNFYVGGVSDV